MNKMTFATLSAVAEVRQPTQRAMAKQRTREKILAAGKALFTERGYERATVRDIAGAAGMSTGAVFASFTDKSDLFGEIVVAQHQAIERAMRAAAEGLTAEAAIAAMFDAAADIHLADLPLFQATMSALWSKDLGRRVRDRLGMASTRELIAGVIRAAIAQGELAGVSDPVLLAHMLWDSYTAAMRRAATEAMDPPTVKQHLQDQIRIILAGATSLG
jgi:AcrR family transcriptional regulator